MSIMSVQSMVSDLTRANAGVPNGARMAWEACSGPWRTRLAILACCLAATAVVLGLVPLGAGATGDPQLAYLLRGMALLKAGFLVLLCALLWWRVARPLAPGMTAAYAACLSVMSAATALIWQLNSIAWAALAFHLALFGVALLALRDEGARSTARARQPIFLVGDAPVAAGGID
jgi:hypothetical protein